MLVLEARLPYVSLQSYAKRKITIKGVRNPDKSISVRRDDEYFALWKLQKPPSTFFPSSQMFIFCFARHRSKNKCTAAFASSSCDSRVRQTFFLLVVKIYQAPVIEIINYYGTSKRIEMCLWGSNTSRLFAVLRMSSEGFKAFNIVRSCKISLNS